MKSTLHRSFGWPSGSRTGRGTWLRRLRPFGEPFLAVEPVDPGSPAIPRGAEARGCVGSPSEAGAPGSSHVTPPELGARFGTGSLNVGSLSNGPLDAPRPSRRLAPSGRPGAAPRPSQLVSQQVLQHLKVQRLVGHDALEPSVLVLKCLQPPRVTDLKAPVLLLPPIERVVADPVASAYLFRRSARLRLP